MKTFTRHKLSRPLPGLSRSIAGDEFTGYLVGVVLLVGPFAQHQQQPGAWQNQDLDRMLAFTVT